MRTITLTVSFLFISIATVFGQANSVPGERFGRPEFPAASLSAFGGKERIDLFLAFDKNGRVNDVTAFGPWTPCSGRDAVADSLRQAAVDAAKKITVPPATSGGKPIESIALIHYTLEGTQPWPAPKDEKGSWVGAMVNGTNISIPKPTYPSIAYRFRIQGEVFINVLIDEKGRPISARPESGHPLLLDAAAKAACGGRWTPSRLDGTPIKVRASVRYKFVL
jgi:hypothetical protein